MGACLPDPRRPPEADPRHRPEEVRALHRPRPDAGPDQPVRAQLRHAELRGPRRLLLGEHGRRHDLHDRRQLLGVRRAGPRTRQAVRDDRHRRGPPLESAEDRDLEVQAPGRPLHLDQPGAHRLLGDRRRMDPDQARHRRRALHGAAARADRQRPHRPRLPEALHQRAAAGAAGDGLRSRRDVRARPRPGEGPPGDGRHPHNKLVYDKSDGTIKAAYPEGIAPGCDPALEGPLHAGRRQARRPLVPAPARAGRAVHARVGRGDHRHPGGRASSSSPTSSARPPSSRRSSCPFPGPTRGATSTRRRRRGRSPSTPCAGWRRTRTAFRPCARWPC